MFGGQNQPAVAGPIGTGPFRSGIFRARLVVLDVRVRVMQASLIQNAHADLVTDTAYDFYGVRLATCSLDHRIKIWQLDESDGTWTAVADWKVRVPFRIASRQRV